ncbi:MAG: HEAT repeat domain-containing protein [Pirellulales bacterium]|nr:HEAT repeat domain-containing protein [Pirellulales bacterium]
MSLSNCLSIGWRIAEIFGIAALLIVAGCNADPSMEYQSLPQPVNQPTIRFTSNIAPGQLIAESLGQIGEPAVDALKQSLADKNPIVRVEACRALGYMGVKANAAVAELIAALDDSEEAVRLEAARALGDIGEASAPAVPRLIELLRQQR